MSHFLPLSSRESDAPMMSVMLLACPPLAAMVGAGILGLPSTFIFLGWGGGAVCLVMFLFISWYTFYLLVQLHEVKPEAKGAPIRRLDSYLLLCQYVLGM